MEGKLQTSEIESIKEILLSLLSSEKGSIENATDLRRYIKGKIYR